MTILLFFAFLAGFVTILAPCIWPLLPIVLSASSGTGKQRPLGITLGVMISFTLFTLTISYLEKIFPIDPNLFRLVAVIIIMLLGLVMIVPALGAKFEGWINRLLAPWHGRGQKQRPGFWPGFTTGFFVGVVWAPCAGPILATIATLAATQAVNTKVVMVTLAYVIGLGIPLFFFAFAGSWVFAKMRQVTKFTGRIQQAFGLIMIVAAILIYTNYDKTIQLKILEAFPTYGNFLSQIETNEKVTKELKALRGEKEREAPLTLALSPEAQDSQALPDQGPAPEFAGISNWLNSEPLTMQELRGKVVLIDFWTYSCINCVRTLPHVTGWYEKYKDKNFVIVGVHTPEFAFEREVKNVENALKQFKINYPVALDNSYGTWKAYKNHYWPAKYLIDVNGRIRMTHFGEGHYEETEEAIRQLLEEAGNTVDVAANKLEDKTPKYRRTPETYLGSDRMEHFASPETVTGELQTFSIPPEIPQDHFAYGGPWRIFGESARAQQASELAIHFKAEKVFLVISPREKGDRIKLFVDDQTIDESMAGADVKSGEVVLDEERLYHLVDLKGKVDSHLLRLEFQNDGIFVYAFTFG